MVESDLILLKYSRYEKVVSSLEIEHPVFREVLSKYPTIGIDISVSSDVPAGTGLGSSSSFTVGLVHLIRRYKNHLIDKINLAEEACEIEITRLSEPIGIQDQYAAAIGGLNYYSVNTSGKVKINNLNNNEPLTSIINSNSILIRIPGSRSASLLLKEQKNSAASEIGLNKIQRMAINFFENLPRTAEELGTILDETWKIKKSLSPNITNSTIDLAYKQMLRLGAYGGKLLGAGSAGYLFMIGTHDFVNQIKQNSEYKTMIPTIEEEGSKIIYESS